MIGGQPDAAAATPNWLSSAIYRSPFYSALESIIDTESCDDVDLHVGQFDPTPNPNPNPDPNPRALELKRRMERATVHHNLNHVLPQVLCVGELALAGI